MSQNTDLKAILLYLKKNNIYLDADEFKFQVESHADYPSLLSFSDALTFFNISNNGFKIDSKHIKELPDSFLALLENKSSKPTLAFVARIGELFSINGNLLTLEQLTNVWREIVFLIDEPTAPTMSKKKNRITYIILVLCILISSMTLFFSGSVIYFGYSLICMLGTVFSIEAIKTELNIGSEISQKFCSVIPNADCTKVINSKTHILPSIMSFGNLSLWFFTSQVFILLLGSLLNNLPAIVTILFYITFCTIPITIYSIYYQYKIAKTWCAICLSIITLLNIYLLLLWSSTLKVNEISMKEAIVVISSFLIFGILTYLGKNFSSQYVNLKNSNLELLRFSKNFKNFKNSLIAERKVNFEHNLITLGQKESKKIITIVTNLHCGFCDDAHELLDQILEKYYSNIILSIRFNYSENYDNNTKDLYIRLYEIYLQNKETFRKALKTWFKYKESNSWFQEFGTVEDRERGNHDLLIIGVENRDKNLSFTPTIFLNEYQYPGTFDRKLLDFFIADWIDDFKL